MSNDILTIKGSSNPVLAEIEVKTAGERLADWLQRLGTNTARAYTRDLNQFAVHMKEPSLGKALVALCAVKRSVALAAVEKYRDTLVAKGLASATINRRLSAINSGLAELAKADMGPGRLDVKACLTRGPPRYQGTKRKQGRPRDR